MTRPESDVIASIDELVDESLAAGPLDDYNVDRYDRCELYDHAWHGLPTFVGNQSCPGAWASDEAKQVWRDMFPPTPTWNASSLPDDPFRPEDWGVTSCWQLTDDATQLIVNGQMRFTGREEHRAALFTDCSDISVRSQWFDALSGELPDGNGYERGGKPIALSECSTGGGFRVLSNRVQWCSAGLGFVFRHAVVYNAETGLVVTFWTSPSDIWCGAGNTLAIDGSSIVEGVPGP